MYLLGVELLGHRICVCSELGNNSLSLPTATSGVLSDLSPYQTLSMAGGHLMSA